ncbi:sigma-70 family RNA polymerase sigma factor [Rubritalea tangerina]|uniref:Sigma-70 family RNA polymerase sigma factor n=1 Tax=Rubritalea tangerina TaxID=430798 RepID=A0ABW4ZAF7_9BACT
MASSPEDQRAFIGLITQHQVAIRAYIISLMPGHSAVADVLQETNMVLWEKRESFQMGSHFTAWAFAIARFEVKNYLRKQARGGTHLVFDDALADDLSNFCQVSQHEAEARMHALEQCLSKLSHDELLMVKNRYSKGRTLSQYAQEANKPVGSLRVLLHRVRKKLRKCVTYQIETGEIYGG